jgi:hypothetical protein
MRRMTQRRSAGPESAGPTVVPVFQVRGVAWCSIDTVSPYPQRLEHRIQLGRPVGADGRCCITSRSQILFMACGLATKFSSFT